VIWELTQWQTTEGSFEGGWWLSFSISCSFHHQSRCSCCYEHKEIARLWELCLASGAVSTAQAETARLKTRSAIKCKVRKYKIEKNS